MPLSHAAFKDVWVAHALDVLLGMAEGAQAPLPGAVHRTLSERHRPLCGAY